MLFIFSWSNFHPQNFTGKNIWFLLPYGSKYSRDNIFVNFVSNLQITKILHSKISVFISFCITYKQALLKNLPSNESKVLIHGGSAPAILTAKIMRYILPNDRERTRLLANTLLLHRTIKSNAMVVDTTCMQALTIRNYKHGATSGLALAGADECKCSFLCVEYILSHDTERFSEYKITV